MAIEDKIGQSLDDIIKSSSKSKAPQPATKTRQSGKLSLAANRKPARQPRKAGAGNKKVIAVPRPRASPVAARRGNNRTRAPTNAGRNITLNKAAAASARISAAQAASANARQAQIAQKRGLQTVSNRLTPVRPNSAKGAFSSRIGKSGKYIPQEPRAVVDSPSKWKITIANDMKGPRNTASGVKMPGAARAGPGAQAQTILRGTNVAMPGRLANNSSRASAPGAGLSLNERFGMIKKVATAPTAGGQGNRRNAGNNKKNLTRNSAGVIMPF